MNQEMPSLQEGGLEKVKKMPPPMTAEEIAAMGKNKESKKRLIIMPDGTTATAGSLEEEMEIKEAWRENQG